MCCGISGVSFRYWTGPGCGRSSLDSAPACSLSLGMPLQQTTSPLAGAAGGPRLTGTRLPVLTGDIQDSDHACCEIS